MPRTRLLALALVTTTACGDAVLNQNDPTLQVVDQSLDTANQITIQKVVAPAVGFVVIREDEAGTPGALVGKLKVEQGVTNGKIKLDGDPKKFEEFVALLDKFDPWYQVVMPIGTK